MAASDEKKADWVISKDDLLGILSRQTDAGNAMVTAGLVEDGLEKLLLTAGRPLSNKTAKKIFGGMGPLSSFSAKIEIAFMFELIDKTTCDDLRTIKDIRNAFAHTTSFLYFGSERIVEKVRALSNWKAGLDCQESYRHRALECMNSIKAKIDEVMYAKALTKEPSVTSEEDD